MVHTAHCLHCRPTPKEEKTTTIFDGLDDEDDEFGDLLKDSPKKKATEKAAETEV